MGISFVAKIGLDIVENEPSKGFRNSGPFKLSCQKTNHGGSGLSTSRRLINMVMYFFLLYVGLVKGVHSGTSEREAGTYRQTLDGSFSDVSKPISTIKYKMGKNLTTSPIAIQIFFSTLFFDASTYENMFVKICRTFINKETTIN